MPEDMKLHEQNIDYLKNFLSYYIYIVFYTKNIIYI